MKLKDLASYAKSWDFYEASLGMAAINSYYNGKNNANETSYDNLNIFDIIQDKVKGKKVKGEIGKRVKLRIIKKLQPNKYGCSFCYYIYVFR